MNPVQLLYHGTVYDYIDVIEQQGLKPVNYGKVYLTADIDVAYQYAKMRMNDLQTSSMIPVICVVDAPQMVTDGFTFDHALDSAEYTVDSVPSKYLLHVVIETEDDLKLLYQYVKEVKEGMR